MDSSPLHRTTSATAVSPKLRRPSPSLDSARNSTPSPNPVEVLLESFLEVFDSSELAVDVAFDRIVESRSYDSEKSDVIQRAIQLGSAITEAAKRSARRFNSLHNAATWPLPSDISIRVFSLVDTKTLCYIAAACTLFRKWTADPMCYGCVDLTTAAPKVDNLVVSTMIQRGGKYLRSVRLGPVSCPKRSARNSSEMTGLYPWNDDRRPRQVKEKESHVLTRSCLSPLISDGGAAGALLRQLHLYNIERIDNASIVAAISACPLLLDLEIIGLYVDLGEALDAVCASCHLIERLVLDSSPTGRDDNLKMSTCIDLVNNCPYIAALGLRGLKLQDCKLRILLKGLQLLKHIDFSMSYAVTGEFLRYAGGHYLEALGLRDCMHLREAEISKLLSSILDGRFKYLRHLDISNREGLAFESDWYHRSATPRFACLSELQKARPNLRVVAEFPSDGSFLEEPMICSSDAYSDYEAHSSLMSSQSRTSGGASTFARSSTAFTDSTYNSDQSSGSEENPAFVDEMHLM